MNLSDMNMPYENRKMCRNVEFTNADILALLDINKITRVWGEGIIPGHGWLQWSFRYLGKSSAQETVSNRSYTLCHFVYHCSVPITE